MYNINLMQRPKAPYPPNKPPVPTTTVVTGRAEHAPRHRQPWDAI